MFFFNDTATTEIYTLSLHDALPIFVARSPGDRGQHLEEAEDLTRFQVVQHCHVLLLALGDRNGACRLGRDRKSTRLNSSHANISYAVFCLKKKYRSFHWLSPYMSVV